MKKPNHKVTFSILGIMLLILVGVFMYGFLKTKDYQAKTDTLNNEIETNSAILRNAGEKSDQLKAQEEKDDLAKLDTFFVPTGQEFTLIEAIEKICSDTKVKCSIVPIGVDPLKSGPDGFQTLHIIVSAQGSFNNLYKLTSIMEKFPYQEDITKVSFQADGENPEGAIGGKPWRETFDFTVTTSPS